MQKIATFFIFLTICKASAYAQFTSGNLVVSRVGNGATSLSNGNTGAVSLVEFNTTTTTATLPLTTQTPITTINLTGGSGNNLTFSGTTNAEGMLNRSQNGLYLSLLGYNVPAASDATNYCITGVSATDNGIMKINLSSGGSGYTSAPAVTITGGAGTGAAASAAVAGGVVTYIYVRLSGSGYTGTPTVAFSGGGGTGATATVDANRTSKGTGYTSTGLTVTFSTPDIGGGITATGGAQQSAGGISNIFVITNGSGYTTQPTVTINHSTGTGAKQCVYINPVFPYWQGTNIKKVIARIDYTGTVDYSTTFSNITTSNGAPAPAKMVASADGSAFWASNNTIAYVPFGGTAATQIFNANAAGIHVYKDQLYSTVPFGNIASYNTLPAALPTVAATANNLVVQSGTTYGFQSMVLFDLDATANWNGTGYDVMYLADRTYGLAKYYWNGTVWTPLNVNNTPAVTAAIFPSGGLASITGELNTMGQPVIYGVVGATTTGNTSGLVAITDASAYNVSMVPVTNTTIAYLAKADANYGFRGVAFAPTAVVLPVTLVSFSAALINGAGSLKWITTSEINAKEFVIEKSANGTNFTALGAVPATNRNHETTYAFDDTNLFDGINYYRIKLVDKDGKFKYSNTVVIKNNKNSGTTLSVFPNPVKNNLVVSHSKAVENTYLKIVAVNGKVLAQYTVAKDAVQTSIDVTKLSTGQYFIQYADAGKRTSISFIK